jgi:hypothetical protein
VHRPKHASAYPVASHAGKTLADKKVRVWLVPVGNTAPDYFLA